MGNAKLMLSRSANGCRFSIGRAQCNSALPAQVDPPYDVNLGPSAHPTPGGWLLGRPRRDGVRHRWMWTDISPSCCWALLH